MSEELKDLSFGPVLEFQLSARSNYFKGKPVPIGFALKNLTSKTLWILTWYTPLEGLKGNIFFIRCDDKEIPYRGILAKRGDPQSDSYVRIAPNKMVSKDVDLSKAYNFPVSKNCSVQFHGRVYDLVVGEDLLPRKRENHQGIDLQGNSVTFGIIAP